MSTFKRQRRESGPALGHDAFLDVVANLVAILIILVVILGARSREIAEAVAEEQQTASADLNETELEEEVKSLQHEMSHANAAFVESQRLEAAIKQADQKLAVLSSRRSQMLDLLQAANIAWQEMQKNYDEQAVKNAKAASAQTTAMTELRELEATRTRLENAPEPIVAVAHLPTPMAKTVFGEELHFRLKDGRLSVVPIERLVREIERDFKRSAMNGRDGISESSVGPLSGYIANYSVNKSKQMVARGGQAGTAVRVELVGMTIEPLEEPYGQPIAEVLQGGATQLDIELAGRSPDRTTVTVWVYPDSFAEFRRLKEHLYSRGFATAARPLPMHMPISASPNGSHSQAQ